MIRLTNKSDCCGCSACVQRCPKQCVSLYEDEEGFLYPQIDYSKCIDCGLCEKVCPTLNTGTPSPPLKCYAAVHPDEQVREASSSGGVFTMLAESVIDDGGVVFGAKWSNNWEVIHSYTDTADGLSVFRGSKYTQSIIGNSYKEAEKFLVSGRKVLFTGTPCQIAGLRLFLRKDYDNLITMDFVCHGVPAPGVFRWYLQEELYNYAGQKPPRFEHLPRDLRLPDGIKIDSINFRDKRSGWKNFSISLKITDRRSGIKTILITNTIRKHPYGIGFLNDYYLRPSCHRCTFKGLSSGADITVADYWGYKNADDDKGVSAVLISTMKGSHLFESVSSHHTATDYEDILRSNPAMEYSAQGPYRQYFYRYKNASFRENIKKLTSANILDKVRRKIWLMTHKQKF